MGKNGKFNKMYGKVVGGEGGAHPGWKGPAFVKKKVKPVVPEKAPVEEESEEEAEEPLVPVKTQQLLLNIFKDTYADLLVSDSLPAILQEVKSALYDRDFERAFGKPDYLNAYSARWSPSRALCYQSLFVSLQEHMTELLPSRLTETVDGEDAKAVQSLRAISFGGGAAEVVAFGGYLRCLQDALLHESGLDSGLAIDKLAITDKVPETGSDINTPPPTTLSAIDLILLDSAKLQDVVTKLTSNLSTPPLLPKYAGAAVRAAPRYPMIPPGSIESSFKLQDVLQLDPQRLSEIVGSTPVLLTLLFTLNELYTFSTSKTTAFLLTLTAVVKPGTLLLVVDSPGSYSETVVGTKATKYPMHWLLNHTLIGNELSKETKPPADWVKVTSKDSEWFRISEELKYPIALENMRYQLHLYRRV